MYLKPASEVNRVYVSLSIYGLYSSGCISVLKQTSTSKAHPCVLFPQLQLDVHRAPTCPGPQHGAPNSSQL